MNTALYLNRVREFAEPRHYAGFDPYDMLNSPLAPILSLGTRFGRIALTQFGRRCPLNFRRLLFVKPGVNPKAAALFLEGYALLMGADGDEPIRARGRECVSLLETLRSPGASGAAWGYNFPWQNRWQCLPRWTPTIVNTAFAGHALLDWYERTGDESALKMARSTPEFILRDLHRLEADGGICFSYTPLDANYVHNANMLGASLLARLAVRYGRDDCFEPAVSALRYSMNHQHGDGSWAYAETAAQSWIDSFHTGFNLEALRRFLELGLTPEYRPSYERGRTFYAEHFFQADGTPNYYHDRFYLADIHAPAEAVSFFAAEGGAYRALTERTARWMIENMFDEKRGWFYFRKAPHFTIRIPYMRWSQAWAFRALARLSAAESGGGQ